MSVLALTGAVAAGAALGALLAWWWARRAAARRDAALDRVAARLEALAQGDANGAASPASGPGKGLEDARYRRLEGGLERLVRTHAADTPQWTGLRPWMEAQPEIVLVHTDTLLYANRAAARALELHPEATVGRPVADLLRPAYRAAGRRALQQWLRCEGPSEPLEVELITPRRDPGLWVELSSSAVLHGEEQVLLTVARDISQRKSLEATLARGKLAASLTLDSIGEGVVTTDNEGAVNYLNSAAEALLGLESGQGVGRRLPELMALVDELDRKPLEDPVARCLREHRRIDAGPRAMALAKAGGREFSVDLAASPIRGPRGEPSGCVVVLHDVTKIRGLTRQMSYQASHDALTGLLNRRELERRVEEALESARAEGRSHVFCYLDFDRFKAVNDTCGHSAGDAMLRELAGLIRGEVRDSDAVARVGGDEFGILLKRCPLAKAQQIADDICTAVAGYRFVWQDRIFKVGVSVGLVEISGESGTLEQVLSAADSACYVAKQKGRGRAHVYSARDESLARQRGEIQWLQQLQAALKDGRFILYTQPIVALAGTRGPGPAVEVLLRLHDDSGEDIAPGQFMGSAERYHLMPRIDRWVMQTTLAALASNALKLPEHRSCAINLSGQTLGDGDFLEFFVDCLDRTGVDPARICFEVSESAVIGNLDDARRFINVLHGIGCRFALDDFGSGMGSFAQLQSLSLDYLKIHGNFTRNLSTDSVQQTMVTAIIDLARALQFQVVAEQLEEQSAFEMARSMGVDFAQGHVVERPQPMRSQA